MAKQNLSKKGVERFEQRRLHKPKVDAKKKKGGPPLDGGVAKPKSVSQVKKAKNLGKLRKKPASGGAYGGGGDILPHGYTPAQRILLVGEGNFSFARALVSTEPSLLPQVGPHLTASSALLHRPWLPLVVPLRCVSLMATAAAS